MVEASESGIRRCMKCGWLFVSYDISRIRRCHDCKSGDNDYTPKQSRDPQGNLPRPQWTLRDG